MRYLKYILLLFAVTTFCVQAQNINGRISSSVYMYDRFYSTTESDFVARGFQTLNLNVNEGIFSLRSSMAFENFINTGTAGRSRFYNLYLEARNLFKTATVKVGRQPLFMGLAASVFDGASIDVRYKEFGLKGFYGGNVPAYQKFELTKNFSDDFIGGAELSTSIIPYTDFSVGYIHKNFMPQDYTTTRLDDNNNPIALLIQQKSNQFRYMHARVLFDAGPQLNVNARYEYDLNYKTTSKVEFEANHRWQDKASFSIYYNYMDPKIRYNSIFSVFDFGNTSEIELGASYDFMDDYTVNARVGRVLFEDESSDRISLGVITPYGTLTYRKNLGIAGELDGISLYTARTYFDGLLTPSIGLSYSSYKLSDDDKKNDLLTIMAGVNLRAIRWLSFDTQIQYLNNPIYKKDLRFLFKINYWFNTNL